MTISADTCTSLSLPVEIEGREETKNGTHLFEQYFKKGIYIYRGPYGNHINAVRCYFDWGTFDVFMHVMCDALHGRTT